MTREEAIAIIENEKKCVNIANKNDYCNRDCYNCELVKTDTEILEALDMAIKALEQTEPEKCGDCIIRQAAIDAFEIFIHELGIEDEPYNYGEMALSVQNVPSVEPERKQGKWIPCKKEMPPEGKEVMLSIRDRFKDRFVIIGYMVESPYYGK